MSVTAAVLDYDAGNLRSAEKALDRAGFDAQVTADARAAANADLVVVPGVGHFGQCVRQFDQAGFTPLIRDRVANGRPVLGICVGLQIMYEGSDEDADVRGLGILPGWVHRFPAVAADGQPLTVPHMGWNALGVPGGDEPDPLVRPVVGERVYFVHSFYAAPSDPDHVIAQTTYGGRHVPAIAREGSVIGTQFHPEKSADVGRRLLEAIRAEVAAVAQS
ncbi:imidazole glycerol phosphate synthase subunit HisH [Euzebya tangerina]|uniref:imidazole glycerol phosphate synthase subunit HisH n=1 Tax=Euzebya tangerina TaxID=591198 RepID=UPI000E31D5F0|nr:imidazole glycerol phosphate synthase subunit HisH [Euzebya tangerina]